MTDAFAGRFPLPPGATIGILGGGQLGRMSALAAARLGYRCHVFSPEPDGPGMQVAAAATVAPYEDAEALAEFADAVDVVTFEFENVPAETLAAIEPLVPCRPGVEVLRICQDRLREKDFPDPRRRPGGALARGRVRGRPGRGASPRSACRRC